MWKFSVVLILYLCAIHDEAEAARPLRNTKISALSGCLHEGRYYYERSLIPTVDSCITCKCEAGMVRCNMTLCPMYPVIQQGCELVHDEGSCCPQLVCDEQSAKKMNPIPEIQDATLLGCTYNDLEFGLGDFIPTTDPCQACYCIHNKTQCVHQNCALPESAREGCRPVYRHGICCPVRYDCAEALASPAPSRPPFLREGCAVNNRLYDEGEAIPSGKSCQHCYCMKGEMICAMQKCDSPMAGCKPIVKEGHCCPERYECPSGTNGTDSVTITANDVLSNEAYVSRYPGLKSTTRALEDDFDLPSTQATTVSTLVQSSSTRASLTPELIQLLAAAGSQQGFRNDVVNSSTGHSSAATPGLNLSSGNEQSSTPYDILPYNTSENATADSVHASELLNSAEALGHHGHHQGQSSTEQQLLQETTSSSLEESTTERSMVPKTKMAEQSPVSSSSQLSDSAMDGNVKHQSNINASSPSDLQGAASVNNANTGTPAGLGRHSRPWLKRPIQLIPVDPLPSDPIEGVLQLTTPSSRFSVNFTAKDPLSSDGIIEGIAIQHSNSKIGELPFAHLEEVGMAGKPADPISFDEFEGKLYPDSPIVFDSDEESATESSSPSTKSPATTETPVTSSTSPQSVQVTLTHPNGKRRPSPLDPEPPGSEVEGVISPSVEQQEAQGYLSHVADPSSKSEIEGALAPAAILKPVSKANHSAVKDTIVPTTVASLLTTLSSSSLSGKQEIPSVSKSENKVSIQLPADPQNVSDIEGVIAVGKQVKAGGSASSSQTWNNGNGNNGPERPADPETPVEVEGVINVGVLGNGNNGAERPADPETPVEVEGVINVGVLEPSKPTVSSSPILVLPLADQVKAPSPADPQSSSEVEGVISVIANNPFSPNVVQSINPLQPVDPSVPSAVEGVLVADSLPKSTTEKVTLPPVDPTVYPNIEGLPTRIPSSAIDRIKIEPLGSSQLEGQSSTASNGSHATKRPLILVPVDPTKQAAVEGVLNGVNGVKTPVNERPKVIRRPPVDPSSGEIEGVIPTPRTRPNWKPVLNLKAVDPADSDRIEGVVKAAASVTKTIIVNQPAHHNATVSGSTIGKSSSNSAVPVDPSPTDIVSGLVQLPPVGANNKPVKVPSATNVAEPLPSDNIEGLLVLPVSTSTRGPVAFSTSSPATTSSVSPNATADSKIIIRDEVPSVLSTTQSSLIVQETSQSSETGSTTTSRIPAGQPANLMMTASDILTPKSITFTSSAPLSTTRSTTVSSTHSPSSAVTTSKQTRRGFSTKRMRPADPLSASEVEGSLGLIQRNRNKTWNLAGPVHDPLPADYLEGLERPNEIRNATEQIIRKTLAQSEVSSIANQTTQAADVVTTASTTPSTTTSTTEQPTSAATVAISSSTETLFSTSTAELTSTVTSASELSTSTNAAAATEASTTDASTDSNLETSTQATEATSTKDPFGGIEGVESVLQMYNSQNFSDSPSLKSSNAAYQSTTASWNEYPEFNESSVAVPSAFPPGPPLSGIYENGCYFEGNYYRNYQSIPTNDLVDPCMVRLCKDGMIFGPSQQRCPPPIEGCFSTSIPGVCCPVYLCPNYLERNETSYTLTAGSGELNTEKTKLALAKFCRVGPRFLALNERVVHVMAAQCQTCTCKAKGIVCEPGCAQTLLITTEIPPVTSKRTFATYPTTTQSTTTLATTSPAVTEPVGQRSCMIRKRRFLHGEEVTFNDPCHICTCMDGLIICKVNKSGCRSAKILKSLADFT